MRHSTKFSPARLIAARLLNGRKIDRKSAEFRLLVGDVAVTLDPDFMSMSPKQRRKFRRNVAMAVRRTITDGTKDRRKKEK